MEHSLPIITRVLQNLRIVSYPDFFKTSFQELEDALTIIQLDAEEKQAAVDAELQQLLEKLDKVLRHIDEYSRSGNNFGRKVRSFCSSSIPFVFGHEINDIKKELDKISIDLKAKCNFTEKRGAMHVVRTKMETISFEPMLDVVGRYRDKEQIISRLLESDGPKFFNVFGNTSIGKTTLAKMVFNDIKIDRHFKKKVWVTISADSTFEQLIRKLIYSTTGERCSGKNMKELLDDIFGGQRCLIILDTNELYLHVFYECYTFLSSLRMDDHSKFILISRSPLMGSDMFLELRGLSYFESWPLFLQAAFRKGGKEVHVHPNLEEIGREIVRKCRGVPLDVITLGQLLCSTTAEDDWKRIRDDQIWESHLDGISPALKLSYDQLPPQMKQCISYCSFFPKDYEFYGFELVQFWMANGLLPSLNVVEEPEVIGMQYLQMLLSKLIFNDFEEENFDAKFKMQGSWHDFLSIAASSDLFGLSSQQRNRHLLFREVWGLPSGLLDSPDRHQTLMFFEFEKIPFPGLLFSFECRSLRTLVLKNSSFSELPRSIDKLKNLKYLDLSGNKEIRKIPDSICSLRTLQTLMLQNCAEIGELPRDMRHMVGLTTLTITTKQSFLPENGIGCLISLRYLAIIGCRCLQYLPQGIHLLTALRTLMIRDCDKLIKLPRSTKYLVALEMLVIANCKMLQLNTRSELEGNEDDHQDHLIGSGLSLLHLCIANVAELVAMPQWLIKRSANSLLRLHIKDCLKLKKFPEWLQNLTSLEDLKIFRCPLLSVSEGYRGKLQDHHNNSASLKRLWIESLPMLSELPWWIVPLSATTLVHLHIEDCQRLTTLPGRWLQNLTSLQNLEILRCPSVTNLEADEASHEDHHSGSGSLKRLWIESLPMLSEFPWWIVPLSATTLVHLHIEDCQRLTTLPGRWLQNLTSLQNLEILRCPAVTKLEADEASQEDHHSGCGSLERLWIESLPMLSELPWWIVPLSATTLVHLHIEDCQSLTTLPDQWLQNLASQSILEILRCPSLTKLEGDEANQKHHLGSSGSLQ